jgi:multiple sugar transport system permease protein
VASVNDPAREIAAAIPAARPGISRRTMNIYVFCYLGLAPVLALFLYLRIIPIVTTLFAGFYNWDMIRPIRVFVGLGNYVELIRDPSFQNALSNTAILAAGSVILGTVFALALAVTVNARISGAPIYQLIYFLPVVTPWVPVTVVWKWIYDARYGPLNAALVALGLPPQAWLVEDTLALIAILIVMVWKTLGYNLIMFLVGLNNIPQEYYEAAVVDGAGGGKIFRYITLPLLRPMLLFVVVISTINAFNVFTPVFMMTSDIQGAAAKLVRTLVYDMWENGFRYFKVGYASAEAALLLLIALILTLMNMRLFREDR